MVDRIDPFTTKMFILLYKKGNEITKYPEQDDAHYDIHEVATKMREIGEGDFLIRRLNYIDVTPDEWQQFLAGINMMPERG